MDGLNDKERNTDAEEQIKNYYHCKKRNLEYLMRYQNNYDLLILILHSK